MGGIQNRTVLKIPMDFNPLLSGYRVPFPNPNPLDQCPNEWPERKCVWCGLGWAVFGRRKCSDLSDQLLPLGKTGTVQQAELLAVYNTVCAVKIKGMQRTFTTSEGGVQPGQPGRRKRSRRALAEVRYLRC